MYICYKASKEFKKSEIKKMKGGEASWEDGDPEEVEKFETEDEAKTWLNSKKTAIQHFSNAGMQFAKVTEYFYESQQRDKDDCIIESEDWREVTQFPKVEE